MPAFLEVPSAILSLGSLSNTAIQVYYANRGTDTAVAKLPAQYVGNEERMRLEAWESGYHLVQITRWEDEPIPWKEQVKKMDAQSRGLDVQLVLIRTEFARKQTRQETVTIYRTMHGAASTPLPGEPYDTETKESSSRYDLYFYTAYFLSNKIQPSGILAGEAQWDGPCRTANTYGALVTALAKGSPAQQAGLQRGDVILQVNGETAGADNLYFLFNPGLNEMEVCRQGNRFPKTIRLPNPAEPTDLAKKDQREDY